MAIDPLTTEIAVKVLCGGFSEYCTILMLQKHELLPVHNMYTSLSKVQMKVFFCDIDCVEKQLETWHPNEIWHGESIFPALSWTFKFDLYSFSNQLRCWLNCAPMFVLTSVIKCVDRF